MGRTQARAFAETRRTAQTRGNRAHDGEFERLALLTRQRVRPKSGMGRVCDYLLNQWESLVQHLRFGQTRLDNNLVENAIRPSCIGKKNWLFILDSAVESLVFHGKC